ncbi:MAG: phosphate acyltransferase PlsX [Candidatus Omnitrophica bacterium]|nr:phosphate acyltransferase PlsX [Candidatus Omnitrophota bacterium]
MKIVVDAMGGDYAPQAVIEGVVNALKEFDCNIILVGIEEKIKVELSKYDYPKDRLEIVHAPEVVDMHDNAVTPLRKKKNSSITIGTNLIKDKKADAFISAGNTAAMVAASTVLLGMLPTVERPAIGVVFPTLKGFSFLIDVGANTEAKPQHLFQSGLMASVYTRAVLGIENPSVGLLNIGEESSKGGGFAKDAHKLMEEKLKNFVGNVEANEVFTGKADCIICDGFVGNIVIKVSEGLMESMSKLLKREISKSPMAMLGMLFMLPRLNRIKKIADYSEYGGAPLLGVNGLVMISHGRSSAKAIKNAIRATIREVEHNIIDAMEKEITNK